MALQAAAQAVARVQAVELVVGAVVAQAAAPDVVAVLVDPVVDLVVVPAGRAAAVDVVKVAAPVGVTVADATAVGVVRSAKAAISSRTWWLSIASPR